MTGPRLSPQPTNTALARFVRRMLDRLPIIVSAGHLRRLDEIIYAQIRHIDGLRSDLRHLEEFARQLHIDLHWLAEQHSPTPVIENVSARDWVDAFRQERFVRVEVTYAPQFYQMAMRPAKELREISAIGMLALERATLEISRATAEKHRIQIIDAVLRQGDFKQ